MTEDGANEIAKRSRGTPRIAGRLLRRVRDFAVVEGVEGVTRAVADRSLQLLDVDAVGLDQMDRKYLSTVATSFGGGPVGIETMAAALSEPRDAIEEIIEPYLIQQGFLQRTPRGRLLTPHAFRHLGLPEPALRVRRSSGCSPAATRMADGERGRASPGRSTTASIGCPSGSTTRTPTSPARSTTRATCASWSGAGPSSCASPASISRRFTPAAPAFIFAVRRLTIDYRRPARMDDVLVVETRAAEIRGASLHLAQRVRRGDELIATAEVRVAAIAGGKPARLPNRLRSALSGETLPGRR